MSRRLPVISGSDLVMALQRAGFIVKRKKGSHVNLWREIDRRRVTVPVHAGRDLSPGTLKAILKDADMSPDQLIDLT